jgi:hypothetical protein
LGILALQARQELRSSKSRQKKEMGGREEARKNSVMTIKVEE